MIRISIYNCIKWILFCGIALTQNSCSLFDSSSDRIIGEYIVLWIDLPANQTICKEYKKNSSSSTVIVPEYVFAVGNNDDFIIAKQHPTSGFEDDYKVDTTITNYYIIDMKRKFIKNYEGLIGPLTEVEFNTQLEKLGINGLSFNKAYPDNPN